MNPDRPVRNPDEYLRKLLSKIIVYRLIKEMSWMDASFLAAEETQKEIVPGREEDITIELLDMLFE